MPAGQRLFFALWPDDPVRHALLHWQTGHLSADVRWQHRDDFHLTLHFLGHVDADRVDALLEVGERLARPAFPLLLDRVGHWPRPKVIWAAPQTCPAALGDLHQTLGGALDALGFALDRRRFQPHVTLARKAPEALSGSALRPPVPWPVRELALVASLPGRVPAYRPLRRWPMS